MATKLLQQNNKIIGLDELKKISYPLPPSLLKAAGMLRRKRKSLMRHLEKVRNEWDGRASDK